ncbi:DUF4345 domain-containing protein [Sphingomonas sp. HF-S3]|uniref:DUF4345 domain-containing protein n=1 Tax=Sphingomonas rustica TaxID=3103142 RepID=A0ABV0B984_9SPHN
MSPQGERRLLQTAVAIVTLVPLSVASLSILRGAGWLAESPVPRDLDSHFRYLSGIFLALGIAYASCIPRIEATTARFRLLGLMVIAGGLARALSLVEAGPPSTGHLVGLGIELGIVPLMIAWQARVARRWHERGGPGGAISPA